MFPELHYHKEKPNWIQCYVKYNKKINRPKHQELRSCTLGLINVCKETNSPNPSKTSRTIPSNKAPRPNTVQLIVFLLLFLWVPVLVTRSTDNNPQQSKPLQGQAPQLHYHKKCQIGIRAM